MNIPLTCYNTNTNEDKRRLSILSKKLLKTYKCEAKVLEALAATGLTDDRSAAHWLVNHADDSSVSAGDPLVFYLLLCPVNDLESSFDEFWAAHRSSRGWCSPMEMPPHVEVVEPFQATAANLMKVYHAFCSVGRFYAERCLSGDIRPALGDCGSADAELSLVVDDPDVQCTLAEAGARFAHELRGCTVAPVQPRRPPFRLAVCCDYLQAQQPQILKEMRQRFHLDDSGRVDCRDTQWQLRLYSRDVRLLNGRTDRLLPLYRLQAECLEPEEQDQLCYSRGDRVALVAPADPPRHGWGFGISCETGVKGKFPLIGAQRIQSCCAWTLHKVVTLSSSTPSSPVGDALASHYWCSFSRQSSVCTDDSGCCQHQRSGQQPDNGAAPQPFPPSDTSGESSDSVATSPKPVLKSSSFSSFFSERPRRQLHVMRHGERLDTTVGFSWFTKAFDDRSVFVNRFDLNIPDVLPTRPREHFDFDSPLSVIGQFVSHQLGEALARAGVRYSHCYSSPALRCVQTASCLLRGAGQAQQPIRIEPLLNEFPYDNCVKIPNFLTPQQLQQSGMNVDPAYKPLVSMKNFDGVNTPEKYLARLTKIFNKILDATKKRGGTILIVGHRTTLEMCPHVLLGQRSSCRRLCIPYNALLCLDEKSKSKWALAPSPAPGFSINEHSRFDAASLLAAN